MNKKETIEEVLAFQPYLSIEKSEMGVVFHGEYQVNECFLGESYFGNFNVRIIVENYPKEMPRIYELESRLAKCEHKYTDGMLCLETTHNLKTYLRTKPSLKNFLIKFLTTFFVNFIHYERTGIYIFGEHKHGDVGIIEMYMDRFGVKEAKTAFAILNIIANKKYRGHGLCPCGSEKRIRKCHGQDDALINMIHSPNHQYYLDDYNYFYDKYANDTRSA